MTKHTPGPWKLRFGDFCGGGKYLSVDAGNNQPAGPVKEKFYEFPSGNTPTEEQVANARLIAAAPELLDALHACLNIVQDEYESDPEPEDLPSWKRAIDNALAAIAKATGH